MQSRWRALLLASTLACADGWALVAMPRPMLGRAGHFVSCRSSKPAMADQKQSAEIDLDALVRQEVEAAFAGLEETLASGDEQEALALIQSQGKEVLENVLQKLEDDGQLLSANLATRVEALAKETRVQILKDYDERLGTLQVSMADQRATLRDEMVQLEALNKEYKALTTGGGGGVFNRDRIVSSMALLVGLVGVGAALNEGLRIALTGTGDPLTIGLNLALGGAGVGYHLVRKG